MKIFFAFISTILTIHSLSFLPLTVQTIGQQCDFLLPVIDQISMNASPWPVTSGISVTVALNGTLTKDEVIGDVIVTESSGTSSSKTNVTINKSYAKGSVFQFSYNFTAPVKPGNYNEKFQAMQNVTQSILMCWQFSYVI